mmetsp:Transcript_33009/g.81751  ORF Transcript_33009/g.81751 Transcript_33009/m.81751 type:complete len:203 (-) Transcript_33009:2446-3054(-)
MRATHEATTQLLRVHSATLLHCLICTPDGHRENPPHPSLVCLAADASPSPAAAASPTKRAAACPYPSLDPSCMCHPQWRHPSPSRPERQRAPSRVSSQRGGGGLCLLGATGGMGGRRWHSDHWRRGATRSRRFLGTLRRCRHRRAGSHLARLVRSGPLLPAAAAAAPPVCVWRVCRGSCRRRTSCRRSASVSAPHTIAAKIV